MTNVLLILLFIVVASCFSLSLGAQELPATSPLIQWTGRCVRDDLAQSVSFDWQSVRAIFTVSNSTSVWATINSTFWATAPSLATAVPHQRNLQNNDFPKFGVYRIYVDGRSVTHNQSGVLAFPGESEYALVTNLDPLMPHNISLWYTTDPVLNSWPDLDLGRGCMQKVVSVRTDGFFESPPPPRKLSMLIIGDSITSGNAMFTPCSNASTCDSSQSYAGLVCEAFSLNCTQLTVSSKGLVHNCCDKFNATVPVLANRTFAQDNSTLFDWSTTPFDAVWIHLGTNDGTQSPPAVFTAAYLDLMLHLTRWSSPGVPVFGAYGPNSDTFAPWVQEAIAQGRPLGINATLVDLMAAPLDGCGHPGYVGHPTIARIAAPIIANITGWAWSDANFPPL
jgi:hypothetical protein